MKKSILIAILIIVLPIAYWLISPLFFDVKVEESLPSVTQTFQEHEEERKKMKDTMVKEDKKEMNNLKKLGTFIDADSSHKVSGQALLFKDDNNNILRLENLNSTNGPDLFVALSDKENPKTGNSGKIKILAKLKGNQGNQNYNLENTKIEDYKSILIYCKAFSVVFGHARIE